MPKASGVRAVRDSAAQLADAMGYEFVDAELVKEHSSVFLRIYVDHASGMDLALCETFHRAVLPLLEAVEYDYLEVSSPGLDRPIKRAQDFEKARGKQVTIKLYSPLDGQKIYQGELVGLVGEDVVVRTQAGEIHLPHKACALIKPDVDMK